MTPAPGQSRETTSGLLSRTGLQQLDDKSGHQGGDSAVALCPRNRQLFDRAVTVLELGNTGLDDGFELAGISLFGFNSVAALATVVGVLIEVPVMLLVVYIVNNSEGWYESGLSKKI